MADNREHPERPIVGVGAVIIKGDQVLLIRRGKPPKAGEWSLPGGGIELGETTEAAVLREVREETRLKVRLGPLIDAVDFIDKTADGIRFHYVLIDYLAFWESGEPQAGTDADEARFFKFDDALALPLWSETKRIIKAAIDLAHKHRTQNNAE